MPVKLNVNSFLLRRYNIICKETNEPNYELLKMVHLLEEVRIWLIRFFVYYIISPKKEGVNIFLDFSF